MPPDIADRTPKARRTRAKLMEAAEQVIGHSGSEGMTVRSVCAAARVGRTSFYNYFEDTAQLRAEVALDAARHIKARFDRLHAGMPRGAARLRACLHMILRLARDEPQKMLLLTELARTVPDMRSLLEKEIGAELSAIPGIPPREVAPLSRFLTLALLTLTRGLADGSVDARDLARHLDYLMRVSEAD